MKKLWLLLWIFCVIFNNMGLALSLKSSSDSIQKVLSVKHQNRAISKYFMIGDKVKIKSLNQTKIYKGSITQITDNTLELSKGLDVYYIPLNQIQSIQKIKTTNTLLPILGGLTLLIALIVIIGGGLSNEKKYHYMYSSNNPNKVIRISKSHLETKLSVFSLIIQGVLFLFIRTRKYRISATPKWKIEAKSIQSIKNSNL